MNKEKKMPDSKRRLRGQTKQRAARLGIAMLMCLLLGVSERFLPNTGACIAIKFALCVCIAVLLLALLKNPEAPEKDGGE